MHTRDILYPAARLVAAMERIFSYRMAATSGGNHSIREDIVAVRPDRLIEALLS